MTAQTAGVSIKETFDTVAQGYDNESLRFFRDSARVIAGCLDMHENLRILDVATGTGNAALELAESLPRARVTGVDFSPGMLAQARAKAQARMVQNVEFIEMDMQAMAFPQGYFDAAVCAFGIFFVDDMERQLFHIADKVKKGGRVIFSCFHANSFAPLVDVFLNRIEKYGVQKPPLRWKRISTEEQCNLLCTAAGLSEIRVEKKDLGYYLEDAEKWWDLIWNAGHRGLVEQLAPEAIGRFKEEHLQEVEKLRTENGLWLNVEVLYAVGVR